MGNSLIVEYWLFRHLQSDIKQIIFGWFQSTKCNKLLLVCEGTRFQLQVRFILHIAGEHKQCYWPGEKLRHIQFAAMRFECTSMLKYVESYTYTESGQSYKKTYMITFLT